MEQFLQRIEKLLTVNCALCYKGAYISEGVIEA